MKGDRDPDNGCCQMTGFLLSENSSRDLLPFLSYPETRTFHFHELPGLVIPAAEKTIGRFMTVHPCNADAAMVATEIADFGGDRDGLTVYFQSPEGGFPLMTFSQKQSRTQRPGQVAQL